VLPRAAEDGSRRSECPFAVLSQGGPPRLVAPGSHGVVLTVTPG
jgi:hypothetical protein